MLAVENGGRGVGCGVGEEEGGGGRRREEEGGESTVRSSMAKSLVKDISDPCICKSPPEQKRKKKKKEKQQKDPWHLQISSGAKKKKKIKKEKKNLCPLHLQIASRENIQKTKSQRLESAPQRQSLLPRGDSVACLQVAS
jgi:ATPase subunit of ABC transporter with duplicated ATPase domains